MPASLSGLKFDFSYSVYLQTTVLTYQTTIQCHNSEDSWIILCNIAILQFCIHYLLWG